MRNHFVGLHLDFIGFSASMLCAVHCMVLPFLLSLTPLMGLHFLENPMIEITIILTSLLIASYAITHGYRSHHRKPLALFIVISGFIFIAIGHILHIELIEITFSALGGTLIATAHIVNWTHMRQSNSKCTQCPNTAN
jgi:hypothetical protein